MKYRELIQFEPVTEVIQLHTANDKSQAAHLIKTYVISDRMADVIINRMLPALRMQGERSGRGLFIVGNYGTGKSHLMSVISAAAEYPDLAELVNHPAVVEGLKTIAGKFKIVRQETGASEMHLRDVIFRNLEIQLAQMGVTFHFPPMTEVSSNKQLLVEMMAKFTERFPDQGLLIALDELLDFLRTRNDRQMVMDLNFLREVGEACEITPLRFVAGIQEALFDNPSFQFAADSIHRVRARFDQVSIAREDIAFVVANRLLVKTDQQRRWIRTHLDHFTPLYAGMAEHLDSYIEMFPVHPAYLEMFEQVTIGERRDLLKAISLQMTAMLDQDVPTDQPGLIAFDAYWRTLSEDPVFRTIPAVRAVQDKARVLEERIRQAADMKGYAPAALRIIDALALQRLTLGDIYAPIGITPLELRDRLCLHLQIPEEDADFLLETIRSVLKEILRTVSGQFISHNTENDQYYLDLKKDIDYDANIDLRASGLDAVVLDRYYFDILARVLELTDSPYVPGFRIWQREIPWPGHGITRQGYIFLGAPNERSTAHPERDFYLHFLAPYGNGKDSVNHAADEVYFILQHRDTVFDAMLKRYAGAREMSISSSGSNKDQYDRKAEAAQRQLATWLRENLLRGYTLIYQHEEMSASEAVGRYHLTLREQPFRDQVFRLGSAVLKAHFEAVYANYPRFEGADFTAETARQAAEAALRAIADGPVPRPAQAVLEGLQLARFESGHLRWTVEQSPYAAYVLKRMNELPAGQVLNRGDLLQGESGAERMPEFALEPEWVLVLLMALARQNAIQINLPGVRVSETELNNAMRLGMETLAKFTSISRPKPLPQQALRELFERLELNPDALNDAGKLGPAVEQLQQRLEVELDATVRMIESLREGPRFWREMVLPPAEQQAARSELEDFRQFLNTLRNLNAPMRLSNLSLGVGEIRAAFKARERIGDLAAIFDLLRPLQPALEYIYQAQALLPRGHAWQEQTEAARQELLALLRDPARRKAAGAGGQLRGRLETLQAEFAAAYLELHNRSRLDRASDDRKRRLTADPRWTRLRALSQLALLPEQQLERLLGVLGDIRTCPGLQLTELRQSPVCPHCGYSPTAETESTPALNRLENVEVQFETLAGQWVQALLDNLQTPEARANLPMLGPKERQAVETFLQEGALPERITEALLNGLSDTLQGLEKLTLDSSQFLLALTRPGMPCTPDELEERIRTYLQKALSGKDRRKTRIQIDW
ncbi:MAG TPA: DUF6079 family protein [Anaerolineaceae bacterium]|nr:DUF6079 family protein [Anaerolineaceae bacterium]